MLATGLLSPWGQVLLRTEWHILKWFLLPSSWWKQDRIFLWYLPWEFGWAPGCKSHSIVEVLCNWVPLELTLRVVRTKPPAIHHLQFRFFYLGTGSHGGFHLWASALVSHYFLYLPSVPSVLGAVICSVSSLLLRIQEELLIFQSVQLFKCC